MADGVSQAETSVIGSSAAGDVLCVGHAFTANIGDQAIFEVIRKRFASLTGLEVHAFPIKPVFVNRVGHTLTCSPFQSAAEERASTLTGIEGS